MLKYLFIFCLLGAAYQFLSRRAAKIEAQTQAAASVALAAAAAKPVTAVVATGFVFMPAPNKAPPDKVIVVAPPDCPKEDGARAEDLVVKLRAAGIPCELTGQAAFTVSSQAEADRINTFMTGALPIVFIRGKAGANPTLADVVAEYQRTPAK